MLIIIINKTTVIITEHYYDEYYDTITLIFISSSFNRSLISKHRDVPVMIVIFI